MLSAWEASLKHREELDALTKALLERETLHEEEILEVAGLRSQTKQGLKEFDA